MSEDASGTDTSVSPVPPPVPPPVDEASAAALQRHRERMRRPRLIYAAVVTALVAVLVGVTVAAWSSGESNNSTLRTASSPPGDLALASPVAAPVRSWQQDATAAIGQPQWGGTVIVHDRRGVRGVDAQTGATTWSYVRSDRTVCTVAQLGGVAMAVFRLRGNCDQVAGFDARTGARKWTRTLDFDGMPVTGTPQFDTSAQGSFGTLLIRTSSVIYALDPSSGLNRWTYARYGCDITGMALGSSGALISQTCSSKVVCPQGEEHCGAGVQLLLRDPYQGRDTTAQPKNPDRITWDLIGTDAVPVSAGSLVSALDTRGVLLQLDAQDGGTVARTTLDPVPSRPVTVTSTDAGDAQLVSIGDQTLAIDPGRAAPLWRRTGTAAATVVARSPLETPTLATARVTVPSGARAETVDARTGRVSATSSLPGATAGDLVYPLGQGFLVARAGSVAGYA